MKIGDTVRLIKPCGCFVTRLRALHAGDGKFDGKVDSGATAKVIETYPGLPGWFIVMTIGQLKRFVPVTEVHVEVVQ